VPGRSAEKGKKSVADKLVFEKTSVLGQQKGEKDFGRPLAEGALAGRHKKRRDLFPIKIPDLGGYLEKWGFFKEGNVRFAYYTDRRGEGVSK